jgi:hypothetical protein
MRNERISDTVFFKHRYITQHTLTQTNIIVKAIDDLTHALKGRKNVKGDAKIEELEKYRRVAQQHPEENFNSERKACHP